MSETLTPDKPETSSENLKASSDPGLDHVWRHFKHHADQRLAMFRFYIVMVGAAAAGLGYFHQNHEHVFSILLSILGAFTSFLFLRIDKRSADLVKISEAALIKFELQYAGQFGISEMTMTGQSNDRGRAGQYYPYSISQILRLLFRCVIFAFLVAAAINAAQSKHLFMIIHGVCRA